MSVSTFLSRFIFPTYLTFLVDRTVKLTVSDVAANETHRETYRGLTQDQLDEYREYAALHREEEDAVIPKLGQAAVAYANAIQREMEEMVWAFRLYNCLE